MVIVDSQVHVWRANTPDWQWLPGQEHRAHWPEPLTPDRLLELMDTAGVDAAVLVPPSVWTGYRNDLALDAAVAHPDRFAVMGVLDFADKGNDAALRSWLTQPGMRGIRFSFYNEPQRTQLAEGAAEWVWPVLADLGIPVMVNAPGLLNYIRDVASRYPALSIAVDHMGLHAGDREEPILPRLATLLELAGLPNVVVKASGLPLQSHHEHPYQDLREPILAVLEAFGADRVFFGTDLSRLPCTYPEAVSFMPELLADQGQETVGMVMGGSLMAWLRWQEPTRRGTS